MSDGTFKLNVLNVRPRKNNENNSSTYLLESFNLWHGTLGHIKYDTLHRLTNLNHILAFQIDSRYV